MVESGREMVAWNTDHMGLLTPLAIKVGSIPWMPKYLPQIVRGEIRWCQGYSEPGSGSVRDLRHSSWKRSTAGMPTRISASVEETICIA